MRQNVIPPTNSASTNQTAHQTAHQTAGKRSSADFAADFKPVANADRPPVAEHWRSLDLPEDPQQTIAVLLAHLEQLQTLNWQLERQIAQQQSAPMAVALPHNHRGHYVRSRYWEVKQDNTTVKICRSLIKLLLVLSLGLALLLIGLWGLAPIAVLDVTASVVQLLIRPVFVMILLLFAIAWFSEAA
jgi:hypothetical protein